MANVSVQLKRIATQVEAVSSGIVLLDGQPIHVEDSGRVYWGDGTSTLAQLMASNYTPSFSEVGVIADNARQEAQDNAAIDAQSRADQAELNADAYTDSSVSAEATARAAGDAASVSTASTDATTKANAAQAFAIQRANHTGTQLAATVSDFNAAALAAAPAETTTTTGALINGATSKATPVDADMVGLMDSAASNILKKLSWANLKATLKTYFDTLYQTIITFGTGVQTALGVNVGTAGSVVVNGGALGTPTSGTATNLTGTATGLTAGALSTQVITRITSDFTTNSTTLVNVTGGTVAMAANKDYIVEITILFQSSVATTGVWFSLNGPASPTAVAFNYIAPVSATGNVNRNQTAYDGGSASTDVGIINTTYVGRLYGIIRNGANAGNLQLRLAAENANNVSIMTGTMMVLTQTN